ncbi:MAG: phosphate ABC transporter permease subunit PstC [Bacteroidales bacterium]|nr:phosphate ABC transporter permease subunit PstC [Bacteroidales bacterium]MDD2322690.1 phosphate ABC transporter permease subunit PstC [Bacteroidales bacterium]MDD3010674.1 phosphate ABC transporter permease subunit PstC [Bacteroidales bacterium]
MRKLISNQGIHRLSSIWMVFWIIFLLILPLGILCGLLFRSSAITGSHTFFQLITGTVWKPTQQEFGFLPFILSSLYVTLIALVFAGPLCLFSAIHICFYAKSMMLRVIQPVIDILAGIPSVVYGVWGILAIVPLVSRVAKHGFHTPSTGYTLLSGGIVLGVMIIPFVLNILIDLFRSVPKELHEASLSLGAGKWYTIKRVVLKKAMPGIISAMGLGLSRAFGETMAVLMVVGNVAQIPRGIFDPGYPLPALIANNYGEMMSIPQYDAALLFAALLLLILVIFFNFASRLLIMRYEKSSR